METETVKLTNWSVSGSMVFGNETWSYENHPHHTQITWIMIEFIIVTFPVLLIFAAIIVSDRRLNSITGFLNSECEKMIVKRERVRAELQSEYSICLSMDAACMPHWKYEAERGNSETNTKQVANSKDVLNLQHVFSTKPAACFKDDKKEHCIFLQLAEMAAPRENTKDSLENIVPSLESSSESMPGPLKHQDYDNSDASWEEYFKGIHEDGLHMPLWNDHGTDMKPENAQSDSLEQDAKVMQEETEKEANVIREHKEVSGIIEDFSHGSDRKESSALHLSQRRKNSKQEDDECISAGRSGIFLSKDRFSALLEDNDCNSVKKSTSEIGIEVGLTEEMDNSHMKLCTNLASGEHITISYPEKVKSKRGIFQELTAEFVSGDEERSVPKSHKKEMVLTGFCTAPKCDTEKQITVEALWNLTAEGESCSKLEIDHLRALGENLTQGSEKSMNGLNEETYQKDSAFRTREDHSSKGKPEDIFSKLHDLMIHMEDKKNLEHVQDTVLADNDISLKAEEEYQPIHPHKMKEHNDKYSNQKNENSNFNCALKRKHSRQMEHVGRKRIRCGSPSGGLFVGASNKEIKLRQADDEYMDLNRRPIHINSLEECDKMVGTDVDFTSEKESEERSVVGEPSDSRKKQIDQCSVPQKVLPFPEEGLEKVHQEERKPFQGRNQEEGFKMKTCTNTDHIKKPHAHGSSQEELTLVLTELLGCIYIMDRNTKDTVNVSELSISDRNMPKEDKSKDNDVHCKEDIKSHEFALLKEIISTWYFFPMLNRFMELCLPSSLQALFQRLISGPPVSQAERMSYEWLRLESFNTLPSSTRGTAIRLAQSGFYYTRQGTRIRCYACNVEHEGWNNTDDPHELHRRISPNCPFLGGYPTYPNFPIIPDTMHSGNIRERSASSATPMIPVIQERTHSRVLETQPVIPSINHISTLHLDEMSVPPSAVADGYLQVPSETVQVEARREKAETQDSSISRKQQQTNSNPKAGLSQPETSPSSSSMNHPQQPTDDAENTQYTSPGNFVLRIPTRGEEDPGVDPMPQTMSERPKHPEHAPLSSRIDSYTNWPAHLDQTPQQMAEAGFFYAGINDYTRCFQCGGGLRNWEPGDNPWIEHARWYPQCAYVLGKRGLKFVNAVLKKQAELLAAQNAERNNSCSTTTTTTTTVISGTGTSSESESVRQPIAQSGKPRYFQNPNENDIASKLIEEMGYQRERVREAILEVKRRRGQQEITIEHAIDLLLADEERRTTAGRQNEAATMQELIQESGQLILHDDSSPPPTSASTTVPPATPTTTRESCQHSGHQHQVAGGRSSGQQQSRQTNQSTGLGRIASLTRSRQNTSGPVSIAVDVPSSSPSFDNREGHQSNKSTAANGPSSPPLLEPISLPALDAESLKEEYLRLRDQNVCKICMERKIDLVFLPCGHLMCCQVCGQSLRICPICRAKINGSAKTYLS